MYEGDDCGLYAGIASLADHQPDICTKYGNVFDGEADIPVYADFTFVPSRDTWLGSAYPRPLPAIAGHGHPLPPML